MNKKKVLNFPLLSLTKDKLSAAGGLGTLMELFDQSAMKHDFISLSSSKILTMLALKWASSFVFCPLYRRTKVIFL